MEQRLVGGARVRAEQPLKSLRGPMAAVWTPPVTMWESDDQLVVLFEVGGVDRDAIELTVVGGDLVVGGYRANPCGPPSSTRGDDRMRLSERPFGVFRRAVGVPRERDASRAIARLSDGVLEVRIPRRGASSRGSAVTIRVE